MSFEICNPCFKKSTFYDERIIFFQNIAPATLGPLSSILPLKKFLDATHNPTTAQNMNNWIIFSNICEKTFIFRMPGLYSVKFHIHSIKYAMRALNSFKWCVRTVYLLNVEMLTRDTWTLLYFITSRTSLVKKTVKGCMDNITINDLCSR